MTTGQIIDRWSNQLTAGQIKGPLVKSSTAQSIDRWSNHRPLVIPIDRCSTAGQTRADRPAAPRPRGRELRGRQGGSPADLTRRSNPPTAGGQNPRFSGGSDAPTGQTRATARARAAGSCGPSRGGLPGPSSRAGPGPSSPSSAGARAEPSRPAGPAREEERRSNPLVKSWSKAGHPLAKSWSKGRAEPAARRTAPVKKN